MPSIDVQQIPLEDGKAPEEEKEQTTVSKSTVGIIYPPPEVRNIVDKTASFVARNGPEFENRIRQNEVSNPKFNFLQPADAYHAYYQHKVSEFKEGRGHEPLAPKQPQSQFLGVVRQPDVPKVVETFVLKDPPPEYEFTCDPPTISAYDLDVVKLTAQFVARNGRQFLKTVMQREQWNSSFYFLRPQHSLFTYFTKLVEQYTKILIPPKNLKEKLLKESDSPKEILDQVKYRVEWAKHQDREKKKEEEAVEKERVSYSQIDWHDFVVVETVDFQQSEIGNLPPPTTPEEVGARILHMERFVKGEIPMDDAVEMEVESEGEEESDEEEEQKDSRPPSRPPPHEVVNIQNMESSSEEDDEDDEEEERRGMDRVAPPPPPPPPPKEAAPPPPLPPTPDQVIIKKNYNPKVKPTPPTEAGADQYMISPITGEKFPAHKVQEHMRIGLLDPKWMEDRQRSMAENQDTEVLAPGSAIDSSLKQLAERRSDIFGVGTEETQIGKKIGEEEKKDNKVVWDGHTGSMEKVSQLAREKFSTADQIAAIHRAKGLLPDEEKEKIGPAKPKNPPLPPPSSSKASLPPPPPPQSNSGNHGPPPPPGHQQHGMPPRPPHPHMPPMQQMMGPTPMGMPQMMVLPPRPPMMMRMAHRPPMMAPVPMGMQPVRPMMPPRLPMAAAPPPPAPMDEPPSKKQKTEESLIPEEIFLQKNRGNVRVSVTVPKVADKAEWNLNGQVVEFTLPITDLVAVLKAKLNEKLGMPAGKQKLLYEGMFVKDSNSLAFYNFTNRVNNVQLQLKERGGRKK